MQFVFGVTWDVLSAGFATFWARPLLWCAFLGAVLAIACAVRDRLERKFGRCAAWSCASGALVTLWLAISGAAH